MQVCYTFCGRDNRGYDIDFARLESLNLLIKGSAP